MFWPSGEILGGGGPSILAVLLLQGVKRRGKKVNKVLYMRFPYVGSHLEAIG